MSKCSIWTKVIKPGSDTSFSSALGEKGPCLGELEKTDFLRQEVPLGLRDSMVLENWFSLEVQSHLLHLGDSILLQLIFDKIKSGIKVGDSFELERMNGYSAKGYSEGGYSE